MRLEDFDFNLPRQLIAQTPARPRDHARLLVYDRKTGTITDDHFYSLDKYLLPKTTLVLNDSKVEKSRLRFGSVEVFVLETINPTTVRALVRPGRKFQPGKPVKLPLAGGEFHIQTADVDEQGIRILRFDRPVDDASLDAHRLIPLPPYITQNENLSEEYQTVYARPPGSKAAPTAGLHFTPEQLERLSRLHPIAKLTLHVGLGTFAPVKTDISKHKMHAEEFFLSAPMAALLNQAGSITAVGTTSVRVLESLGRPFKQAHGTTDIFITPGYEFQSVDSLITNFHLPKSTLLMLVAAFIGSPGEMHRIYGHAIKNKYRFYSFGDAMLIL